METHVFSTFEELEPAVLELLQSGSSALIVNGQRGDVDWFRAIVRDAEAGLFDFDGTLHAGNQWTDIVSLCTLECQAENIREREWYFARGNGEPSAEEITRFGFNTVRRMVTSGVLMNALKECAQASPPRVGAIELLESFSPDRLGTPSRRRAIVSFGVYDYILAWCRKNKLVTPLIASTHLQFSSRHEEDHPTVTGADPLTFVGTHTKGHVAHAIVESFGLPMERVLVVGDSPTDMQMMMEGNIAVLIVPHRDDDKSRAAFRLRGLAEMWPRVAAVLVSDSLQPLADMRR